MSDAGLDELADALYFANSESGPNLNLPASVAGILRRGGMPILRLFRRRRLRLVPPFRTPYRGGVLRIQFDPATCTCADGQKVKRMYISEFERAPILGLSHPEPSPGVWN